jgi:uncharacterized protein YjbJ (UPF0337 family)
MAECGIAIAILSATTRELGLADFARQNRTPADAITKRDPDMALNQQTLEGNWNEIKGKLHERWGQLTQDDLQQARGNVDQLVGVIQRKTGEARERVEQYLNEITSKGSGGVSRMAETVRGYASSAADTARGYASTAGETAEEARARAAEMLRGGYVQTERMIQQRPMESLAVGFGTGLITGVIIGLAIRSGSGSRW